MKIGVIMVAYNNADNTRQLFESANTIRDYEVEYHLFLHSQEEDVVAVCEEITRTPDKGFSYSLHYHAGGFNRGLAKSWNDGMLSAFANGCQVVIIANDDIVFGEGDLTALAECAFAQPHHYIVTAQGYSLAEMKTVDMGYSCFAVNPLALEKIGCFDENIFPIYFEDSDYHCRALRMGLERTLCATTNVLHAGSASIKPDDPELMAQHVLTFTRNKEYYLRKWGGEPGQEVYETPFGVAEHGFRIDPENRHHPYGADFDRTDQEIVQR